MSIVVIVAQLLEYHLVTKDCHLEVEQSFQLRALPPNQETRQYLRGRFRYPLLKHVTSQV